MPQLALIVEAAAGTDCAFVVRPIRAGLSVNNNYYPDTVLRAALPFFEGVRVFVKGDKEHLAREGKDVRNLIGGLRNARFVEGAQPDTGYVEAELHLIIGESDPVAVRLREAVQKGMTELFGLSIDGLATAKTGARGQKVAQRFVKISSVDLIVDPGAGGQVIKFVEAAAEEGSIMDRDQLLAFIQANNPALLNGVDTATVTIEALQALLAGAIRPQPAPTVEAEAGGNDDPATMTRDQIVAAITALDASRPPADIAAASDDDLRAILAALRGSPAGNTAAVVEAAVARALDLRDQINTSGLPEAGRRRLLSEMPTLVRMTEAAATARIRREAEYLASLGLGRVAPPGIGRGERHMVTEDQADKHTRMLEAFFDPAHADHQHARSFKQVYIDLTGDTRVTGLVRNATRFTEALDSTSFSLALGDSITRRMIADYRSQTDLDMWKLLTGTPVPVGDFRSQERVRVGGYGDLPAVAQGAPYVALNSPDDDGADYAVTKRGGLETITLEMIKNDDVGAIQRIPVRLARAAKRTLCKFVLDFIRTNPVIYDGVALFHATHNNLGAAALAAASYAAGRLAMSKQAEAGSNEALGIGPRNLWAPADLEETAANLFQRGTNLDKTFVQSLMPNIVPVWYWTDANDWAATADVADIPLIELGFLDGEEEPTLLVQDNPSVGSMFSNDQLTYKIRHIYGGAVLDYRGFYKALVA